jgi:hypothetical protein
MNAWQDSVAFWATILGTLVGLFGVVQSLAWIAVLGVVVTAGSIGALFYAYTQRLRVQSADLVINGRGIDSLGMANLRRRLNRTLSIQEVRNEAVIDGQDLALTWHCAGYCRAGGETAIEFSIDADANVPFEELACSAYDLRHDPRRRHPIRPILVGPDGISKKIAVPFLSPLEKREPFSVLLTCRLPGCMKAGVDYYTATLSFAQDRVRRYAARITFLDGRPEWLRVYERRIGRKIELLKDLRPVRGRMRGSEYLDTDRDVPAASARIYVFLRQRQKRRN